MEMLLKIWIFFEDIISRLWWPLYPVNPQILRRKYYEVHRMKLQALERERKTLSEKNVISSKQTLKLLSVARLHAFRASLVWGSRNFRQKYESAWFNVLAGEAYQIAHAFESAGRCFHLAARSFDDVGECELAGQYFHESALCLKKAGDIAEAIQALKRGVAAYHHVEEEKKADNLKNLINEWEVARK